MKKILSLIIVAVSFVTAAFSQQSPYEYFTKGGTSDTIQPMIIYQTADSNSNVKLIELNLKNYVASFYDRQDSLLQKVNLKPERVMTISVDPKASKYPSSSPYNYVDGNPISRTDPDGADWFRDGDGNTQWFEASGEGFSDVDGVSWTNIGTEFLEFNGTSLTYSWQTGNAIDGYQVHSQVFEAVSGKGTDPTGYWNQTRIFDYSQERQQIPNVGPTPEGLYSINKSTFAEGTNEGGTQRYEDLPWWQKTASSVARGTWPGGTSSWGLYRWQLQFENAPLAEEAGRGNFYLHGGSLWGSRGCIDCGANINAFYQSFVTTNANLPNDKVYLKVKYAEDLKFEIQNRPTTQPINFITR